jgi:hypothetical protein
MHAPFARSDYYGNSATARHHQPTACLPSTRGVGRAAPGRFPRSPPSGRRVSRPAIPRQHRHAYAAVLRRDLPTGLNTPASESPPPAGGGVRCNPAQIRQVRAGGTVTGRQTLVSRVQLPVSLAGPALSGSASTSRRCQGCSHLVLCLQDPAALSFPSLLRQASGGALPSPPGNHGGASWRTFRLSHTTTSGPPSCWCAASSRAA